MTFNHLMMIGAAAAEGIIERCICARVGAGGGGGCSRVAEMFLAPVYLEINQSVPDYFPVLQR